MKTFLVVLLSFVLATSLEAGRGGGGGGSHSSSSHSSSSSGSRSSSGYRSSSSKSSSGSSYKGSSSYRSSTPKTNSITGRTNVHGQYSHVTVIQTHEYHYYERPYYSNGQPWLLYYLLLNNHTHTYDTIHANTKAELDQKVQQATSEDDDDEDYTGWLIFASVVVVATVGVIVYRALNS